MRIVTQPTGLLKPEFIIGFPISAILRFEVVLKLEDSIFACSRWPNACPPTGKPTTIVY